MRTAPWKLLAAFLGIVTAGGSLAGEATRQSRSGDEVRPGAVLLFAWAVLDPVPLTGGASAPYSEFDRAPSEYRQLERIDASEDSQYPRTFDATVVIVNESREAPGKVEVTVSVLARTGPLLLHPELGVTDIERGVALSAWEKRPVIQKKRTFHLDRPGRYYSASIEALPFQEMAKRLWAADKWPFEIEVVATLACTRCRPENRVARRVQAVPGD